MATGQKLKSSQTFSFPRKSLIKKKRKGIYSTSFFILLTLVLWGLTVFSASAGDLIINGETVNVDGGNYGIILVKNEGNLTINGDTSAKEVLLQAGKININGNLDVETKITVQSGTMTVTENTSAQQIIPDGGTIVIEGNANTEMPIIGPGKLTVKGTLSARPISRQMIVNGETVIVDGWDYDTILVKNEGNLTINGDTSATEVLLQTGKITINGNLDASTKITVQAGTMTVTGNVSAQQIIPEAGTIVIERDANTETPIVGPGKLTVRGILSAKPISRQMIVNGETVIVDGWDYDTILVKNEGNLTINGDTSATEVLLQLGKVTINGNLDASAITVQAGTMTVTGNTSAQQFISEGGAIVIEGKADILTPITVQGMMTVKGDVNVPTAITVAGTMTVEGRLPVIPINVLEGKMTVFRGSSSEANPVEQIIVQGGELHLCGEWFANDVRIESGTVKVIPFDDAIKGSGTLTFVVNQLVIEEGGAINADGAGGDTRGEGDGDSGGGYGGEGGSGSREGVGGGGNIYGNAHSLTIEMGSRGGSGPNGGGSISILSADIVTIHGKVTSNGYNGGSWEGGGSGGGILIHSPNLILTGAIEANGGTASSFAGGGGGGRIKLFYVNGFNISEASANIRVNGAKGGEGDGQDGTIWTNVHPSAPELIAPEDGTTVSNKPTFSFTVIDPSVETDNRNDSLSGVIELSQDNFATVYRTYSQDESLEGWSAFLYYSGEKATFTPSSNPLPEGKYQWRAAARDGNFISEYSEIRSFTVGPSAPALPAPKSLTVKVSDVIMLSWTASEAKNLAGYKVYYDTSSGGPYNGTGATEGNSPIDAGNVTEYTISGLPMNLGYYLTVTAYDKDGNESGYATEVGTNTLPITPTNKSPADGTEIILQATPLTLEASEFSDLDGDAHAASQWQVAKDGDFANPVYDSDVDKINKTNLTLPADVLQPGTTYQWRVRYQDSAGLWSNWSRKTSFTTKLHKLPIDSVFTATLVLKKGINIVSLPLNPDTPYTASSLAAALNATIVIQVKDGFFDAYVHKGSIGADFPIQMGKGYIVNLMEEKNLNITGKPWGVPVPSAPSISDSAEPWAFVIAGHLDGEVPVGGKMRATNLRTGESITAPISPSGQFTAAFVDMSRQSVVAEGDEIVIQIISESETNLIPEQRCIISHEHIANAYLLTHLSAKPEQTRLLQNYPNPFNPETWIPYQLDKPADVTIHIYNAQGQLIHTLFLGQRSTGFYLDRSKAAYWNGRNTSGEKVASGLYFYQLKAGDFTATRRMVIVK